MKKTSILLAAVALMVAAGALGAHDMFLKLESFFLEPHARATITLLNGTFDQSQNAIARDRMTDVSVVGPSAADRSHAAAGAWRDVVAGIVEDTVEGGLDTLGAAELRFETGDPGTYVVGVSTRPRTFTLSGQDFDGYLEHDGVLDVLERRRREGTLGTEATETYAKHVKAVVQVGETRSDAWDVRLGYPAELVPLQNPYALGVGDTLDLLFLRDGEPVADQLVYASYEGFHAHEEGGGHVEAVRTRTDAEGVARIPLSHAGKWYARLINMVESPEPDVDYRSKWATLTWAVR